MSRKQRWWIYSREKFKWVPLSQKLSEWHNKNDITNILVNKLIDTFDRVNLSKIENWKLGDKIVTIKINDKIFKVAVKKWCEDWDQIKYKSSW